MATSLEQITRLLVATLDDITRLSALLDAALQQGDQPAFELSPEGVIWYLNRAACAALGVDPHRAVGTRLAAYVADGWMTQRRLEALGQPPRAQSWPDAWRREKDSVPCQLTGFAIPRALAGERPRLVVWAESPGTGAAEHPPPADGEPPASALLPADRPVLARDLDPLRRKLGLGVNRFCELLGITPVTWYAWRKHPDAPLASRTTVLHLRLLDALPELAQPGPQPLDLQEALRAHRGIDLTFTELALLLGVERRAGYGWSRGYAASDQVRALSASLLYLVFNKPREVWDQYQRLLDRQAALEGVDLGATKSWATGGPADAPGAAPARPTKRGRPFRTQGHPPVSEPAAAPVEPAPPAAAVHAPVAFPRASVPPAAPTVEDRERGRARKPPPE
ncbi:MAG: hypothetical protein EA420_03060 [Candidatus Competibacteraceae bacterium]|nr:MAG: hypothetical protein EA420_03060 [Candidatus Competibacteraceae bacterium]